MTVETYLAYLGVIFVFFAGPPGPSQLLMISNSLRHGFAPSRATIAGDLSANALQMTAAGFGLATIVSQSAEFFTVVKWLGVAYLLWIGIRAFRAKPKDIVADKKEAIALSALYRQGFLTSAANPKAVVFFAALFPQFIDPQQAIGPQVLILGATYIVVDGALLLLYGKTAERFLGALRSRGTLLNRLSGSLMIAAAGLLALKDARVR